MFSGLVGAFVSAALVVHADSAQQTPTPAGTAQPPAAITMTGCISAKPGTSGQYTFSGADDVREYRLTGKGIDKFAGLRVELVGDSPAKSLTVRGGLWPTPSGGARGVAQSPAQESVSRQPGAGGKGARGEYPELRVSRLRAVEGACK
jgi:hypothetical protein